MITGNAALANWGLLTNWSSFGHLQVRKPCYITPNADGRYNLLRLEK